MDLLYRCNKKIGTSYHTFTYDRAARRGRCSDGPSEKGRRAYRMLQISDLQSEYFGEGQSELLAAVYAASPDLTVITGDLVDRSHTDYLAAMLAVKGALSVSRVAYIPGNHEIDLPEDETAGLFESLGNAGVDVMTGRVMKLEIGGAPARGGEGAGKRGGECAGKRDGEGAGTLTMALAGLSEYDVFRARAQGWGTGRKEKKGPLDAVALMEAVKGLTGQFDPAELNVVLVHEPQYFGFYAVKGVDLVLAGHAHGGQFRLPSGQGLFSPGQGIFPRFTEGAHEINDTTMIVSRGLGNSSFPLRLNDPPELVCVDIVIE
ncbi:MAG: metallophosphoesterase [Anaerovoracaceae bacterium]